MFLPGLAHHMGIEEKPANQARALGGMLRQAAVLSTRRANRGAPCQLNFCSASQEWRPHTSRRCAKAALLEGTPNWRT